MNDHKKVDFALVCGIIVAIAGFSIAIFFALKGGEESSTATDNTTNSIMASANQVIADTANPETEQDPDQEALITELTVISENPEVSTDKQVEAIQNLAALYRAQEKYDQATNTLNQALQRSDLSDANRCFLYMDLYSIYDHLNDRDGKLAAVNGLLSLPEDTPVNVVDWSTYRQFYIQKKAELENAG